MSWQFNPFTGTFDIVGTGGGGGGGSPGGASLTVQYNNGGSFAGMSGTSWDDANRSLTLTGATVTTDKPVLDLSQTWNAAGVTFTGLRFNATDTASAAGSLLLDLEVGGVTRFSVTKASTAIVRRDSSSTTWSTDSNSAFELINADNTNNNLASLWFRSATTAGYTAGISARFTSRTGGGIGDLYFATRNTSGTLSTRLGIVNGNTTIHGGNFLGFSSGEPILTTADTFLTRANTATLQLGNIDATTLVPQILQVQSATPGALDTAGANFTIRGSRGTGTGAGGSIIFQVAPAGTTGTAQNALATALTIGSNLNATFAGSVISSSGVYATSIVQLTNNAGYFSLGGDVSLYRDAANTLALRNGANAQTFNVYNTYTDAANYERGVVKWASNVLQIGTENAGTGSVRQIQFLNNGSVRAGVDASGHFFVAAGRSFFLGGSSSGGGGVSLTQTSNNLVLAGGNITLTFGGGTTSFPALKRSAATLQVRSADDSGFATIDGQIQMEGTAPASATATGTAGDLRYDSGYIYVCTATDTWKRVAIATWP